jgi:GxxExxY protein
MNTDKSTMTPDKPQESVVHVMKVSDHAAGISEAVIGASFRVANVLGTGFLEKVYENALAIELRRRGRHVVQQKALEVRYEREIVGTYQADLVVDDTVVVELKAVTCLDRSHRAQCLNYLRATGMVTGLVINFGNPRVEVQRVVSFANAAPLNTDEHEVEA